LEKLEPNFVISSPLLYYSCLNKTDMIRVLNGKSSRSPVIALICNDMTDYEVREILFALFIIYLHESFHYTIYVQIDALLFYCFETWYLFKNACI